MAERYTSGQVAKKLGLPVTTLSTYITAEKIPKPQSIVTGKMTIYLWTEEEIEHVRQLLPKIANGRKTRYQKKQIAASNEQLAKPKPKGKSKTTGSPNPK